MPTMEPSCSATIEVTSAQHDVSIHIGEIGKGHRRFARPWQIQWRSRSAVAPMFGRLFSAQIAGESSRSHVVWSPSGLSVAAQRHRYTRKAPFPRLGQELGSMEAMLGPEVVFFVAALAASVRHSGGVPRRAVEAPSRPAGAGMGSNRGRGGAARTYVIFSRQVAFTIEVERADRTRRVGIAHVGGRWVGAMFSGRSSTSGPARWLNPHPVGCDTSRRICDCVTSTSWEIRWVLGC